PRSTPRPRCATATVNSPRTSGRRTSSCGHCRTRSADTAPEVAVASRSGPGALPAVSDRILSPAVGFRPGLPGRPAGRPADAGTHAFDTSGDEACLSVRYRRGGRDVGTDSLPAGEEGLPRHAG